jgi:hypothetical protein
MQCATCGPSQACTSGVCVTTTLYTHADGFGHTWQDGTPPYTYTEPEAMSACNTDLTALNTSLASCTTLVTCPCSTVGSCVTLLASDGNWLAQWYYQVTEWLQSMTP